jgi:hypothetical protein
MQILDKLRYLPYKELHNLHSVHTKLRKYLYQHIVYRGSRDTECLTGRLLGLNSGSEQRPFLRSHITCWCCWPMCYLSLCYRLLWSVPLTMKCFYEERGFTVSGSELPWIFIADTILRGTAEWPSQSPRCRSVWSTNKPMCGRCK